MRAQVFGALRGVEAAMMQGQGYPAHTEDTTVLVLRAQLTSCYGATVAELFMRVVELEFTFVTGVGATLERKDSAGFGPQILFATGTPQAAHYDAMAGDQFGLSLRLNDGTDTALGPEPSLDIVKMYESVVLLGTAEERAVAIAEAMIALRDEFIQFKPQPARSIPAGTFQAFRNADSIHLGRGGVGRRTLFAVLNVPSSRQADSRQDESRVVPTAEYPYDKDKFALNPQGVTNTLCSLRLHYRSPHWAQCWPDEDVVLKKIKEKSPSKKFPK